jgi:coenzyme F420 hydrogenase subunit delta
MIRDLYEKPILVFGCGNILFGDDGFGPAVAEHLENHHLLPEDVLVMDVGTSIRDILFDLALSEKKPKKIIIVDAVDYPDRRPGEIFEIPVEGIPEKKTADFSLHQFPTVNILRELKDHTGIEITVLVAQTDTLPETIRPGLSKAMENAVVKACERILLHVTSDSAV